jgi:hypothetical protein
MSGVYLSKILLTIYTKQNCKAGFAAAVCRDFFACQEDISPVPLEKVVTELTAFFKHAADTAASTPIPESYTLDTNNLQGIKNHEDSEIGDRLYFSGCALGVRCRRGIRSRNASRDIAERVHRHFRFIAVA